MALKLLLLAAASNVAASLNTGDCAFVGIYGDQDDFALVLMEDANGEKIFVTEELPTQQQVSKFAEAKDYVHDAKRGSVLKKADFQTGTTSFVAPLALTAFKGTPKAPEVLCSINLEENAGASARKLDENMVMLGMTETAEYAGSTSGTKEELLAGISNPQNWMRNAARKLEGFSVAKGNMTTTTMTTMMNTTMEMTTTTMEETTTMMDTTAMDTTTMMPTTTEAIAATVSGCIGFESSVAELPAQATEVFQGVIADSAGTSVTKGMVKDVVITTGACANRRLSPFERRLQTVLSVTYTIVFPVSMADAVQVANTVQTTLSAITPEALTTTITTAMADSGVTELASITVTATVNSLEPVVVTTMMNTTMEMTTTTAMTTMPNDEQTTTVAPAATLAGCVAMTLSEAQTFVDSPEAKAAVAEAIAALATGVTPDMVQDIVIMVGDACSRRLQSFRRLQSGSVTVSYVIVFTGDASTAMQAAELAQSELQTATLAEVTAALTTAVSSKSSLSGITVDVTTPFTLTVELVASTSLPEPGSNAKTTGLALAMAMLLAYL